MSAKTEDAAIESLKAQVDWGGKIDAVHVRTLLAGHAAQAERIASLTKNLRRRDAFIVDRGLWFDFIDHLPASGKASA